MTSSIPSQIVALFDPPDIGTCYFLPADDSSQNQGTGSASNPFRLQNGNLDEAFRMMNEKVKFHRLHLYAGNFFTGGRWTLSNPMGQWARPFALTGEGPDLTKVTLYGGQRLKTATGANKFTGVLWAGSPDSGVDGVSISNLCVQGNSLSAPKDIWVTGGVVVYGANAKISNVRVSGLRGSESAKMEAFGILTNSAVLSGEHGGSRIEDCEVRNNATDLDDYFTGIYCGHVMGPGVNSGSIVRGCRIISFGKRSNIAFSFNSKTTFRDCSAVNVRYGFYNDTDAVHDVRIDGCSCEEVEYAALSVIATDQTSKTGISLLNSRFTFALSPTETIGLVVWDKGGAGTFSDILVENCAFDSETPRFTAVSMLGSRIKNVRMVKCIVPDKAFQNLQGGSSSALSISGLRSASGVPIANLKNYAAA